VKAPSGCGKWAGKTVTELQSIYAQFDPINGESYTETSNFYIIAGTGRVCLSDQIVESMYDNRTTGALASTTTIATTQVLTAETIH
jgi:hypothetical protein